MGKWGETEAGGFRVGGRVFGAAWETGSLPQQARMSCRARGVGRRRRSPVAPRDRVRARRADAGGKKRQAVNGEGKGNVDGGFRILLVAQYYILPNYKSF